MSTQPEIIQLRDKLEKLQEQARRSRSRGIFGFGLLIFVIILSSTYAFVQQVQAEKNAMEANRQRELAENTLMVAESNAAEAQMQRAISEVHRAAADRVQEELQKCQSSRKR